MNRPMRRGAALLALAVAVLATVNVATALAHVQLVSTSPSAGAGASRSLTAVKATFSGPIRSGTLRVVDADGRTVSARGGGRDPRNVRRLMVGLNGRQKSGRYTARWSIVAADGHAESGSFRFRLR
jgi:methionine-rich copper-binding protein CopC